MSSSKEDPKSDNTITVNVDDFTRTRDNVILSIAQLQAAVSDLSRAYINHANTVLNRGPAGDLSQLTSGITHSLYEHGLLGHRPTSPGGDGDKKKRKRAPPDPNAPKRALTPFFLYMSHNRPKIAKELGSSARPKDVADEGQRRWNTLPASQREIWKKMYADNLASYREKMKAYKAGLPIPDDGDDSAKAASQLQQDVAGADASEDESEQSGSESEREGETESESSPSPAKEPSPPRGKRRRSEAKTAAAATPKKEDEKKKRTSARKEKEDEASVPTSVRKTADKRSKKKRKSEAGPEE